uniref:Myb/SANT-like domain-containing protein n=1 Tax=Lactuca sativa TaxID=4236 RepID=A0A9R1UST7_LACSA|nr:hypothetical protein LSAT_V11C800421780 [Lactuca sativa]
MFLENMKREWKLYEWLMRLETGLGGTRSLIEASPDWWEEKIKENKDYAKFRDTNLSIFDEKYVILFRDFVAIGDQTMTPLQFQNNSNPNEENMEGKGDSDEINLDDDESFFPSFLESSSTKREKKMSFPTTVQLRMLYWRSYRQKTHKRFHKIILPQQYQIAWPLSSNFWSFVKGPRNFHKHWLPLPKRKIVMLLCFQRLMPRLSSLNETHVRALVPEKEETE